MKELKREDIKKSPFQLVFYTTEKDLCEIVSMHLSENIECNIEILKKITTFKNAEVIEIKNKESYFYIERCK